MKVAARFATVFVLTAAGIGVASPAFATSQVDVTVCDTLATSVEPGGCVAFSTIPLTTQAVDGDPLAWGDLCASPVPPPTVTTHCVIFEVDVPN